MKNIELRINGNCNFECSYCVMNKGYSYNFNDIKKTLRHLETLMNVCNEKFDIYLMGGEPTIHPKIVEISKIIKTLKGIDYYAVQTNLSLTSKKLFELLPLIDSFMVSFHPTELEKKGLIDIFFKNLEILIKQKKTIGNFDIMYEGEINEKYSSQLSSFIEKSRRSELIYSYMYHKNDFKPQFSKTTRKYSFPELKLFNISTNELFELNPSFRGFTCSAGVTGFSLEGDGKVFRCASHLTKFLRPDLDIHPNNVPYIDISDFKSMLKMMRNKFTCPFNMCSGNFEYERYKLDTL